MKRTNKGRMPSVRTIGELRRALASLPNTKSPRQITLGGPKAAHAFGILTNHCQKRFGTGLTVEALNRFAGEVAVAFDLMPWQVNAMTLKDFVDKFVKLDSANSDAPKHDFRKVGDDDPIEDLLSGQLLTLYRHLKARARRTPFDALAKLKKCWRADEPSDDAIVKALKRLQTELNKVSVSLVVEAGNRRTYLDK